MSADEGASFDLATGSPYIRKYYSLPETINGRSVIGLDIGTWNFGITRLVRSKDTGRVVMTHAALVTLRDPKDVRDTIDNIGNNILQALLDPTLDWIWHPQPGQAPGKHYITLERQNDQLKKASAPPPPEAKNAKKKRGDYKPPINFAIYGMILVIGQAIKNPAAFMNLATLWTLTNNGEHGLNVPTMGNVDLEIVPRSGSQKTGLKGLHGEERKSGPALEEAMRFMEEQKDDEGYAFMNSLGRDKNGKPLQDMNDAYLQALHKLLELEEEDRKAVARAARAEKARAPKPAAQKRKRNVIEKEGGEDGQKAPLLTSSSVPLPPPPKRAKPAPIELLS